MMQSVAIIFLGIGLFFMLVATIGFIRLPDVFCRLHVTGVMDTLGAPLILLSVAVDQGPTLVSCKLVLMVVFLYVTAPLISHLLARAALESGHRPQLAETQEHKESPGNPPDGASHQ